MSSLDTPLLNQGSAETHSSGLLRQIQGRAGRQIQEHEQLAMIKKITRAFCQIKHKSSVGGVDGSELACDKEKVEQMCEDARS